MCRSIKDIVLIVLEAYLGKIRNGAIDGSSYEEVSHAGTPSYIPSNILSAYAQSCLDLFQSMNRNRQLRSSFDEMDKAKGSFTVSTVLGRSNSSL